MGLGFFIKERLKKNNMKKLFTSIVVATITAASVSAQVADGFYYVKNNYTGRYMSIQDNNAGNYKVNTAASTISLKGIKTYKSWDDVSTMPSCVIYVKKISGNEYDFEAQGSGLHKLSGNRLYPTLTPQADGTYICSGTYKGAKTNLVEWHADPSKAESYLKHDANEKDMTKYWIPIPINTGDNYLGIKPDVKTDDGYYGTIYAGFAFKLVSDGMKAYYISEASGSKITLKEISGTIPAATPVIIKCASNDPKKNKIQPLASGGTALSNNQLKGVYCASIISNFGNNITLYNASTMRVIGTSGGKLAFVKASEADLYSSKYLKANKAYLAVASGSADTMTETGTGITTIQTDEVAKDKEGLYTLTGVKVPDNVTPQPGIYIKDGKKVIIK